MASLIVFLMECIIAMLIFGVIAEQKLKTEMESLKHEEREPVHKIVECFCGVFKEDADVTNGTAMLEKKVPKTKFNHSVEGELKCKKACISMAEAAKDKVPSVLCSLVPEGHADKLMVKLYSRLCEENKWNYTGKGSIKPICCHKGQPIKCVEAEKDAAETAEEK